MTITTPAPTPPSIERAALLAADYLSWRTQRDQAIERMDAITTELRSLGAGDHEVGDLKVTVQVSRRFDGAEAAKILPADTLALIQDVTISAAKAKRILAPALYELCMTESGSPRVTVK